MIHAPLTYWADAFPSELLSPFFLHLRHSFYFTIYKVAICIYLLTPFLEILPVLFLFSVSCNVLINTAIVELHGGIFSYFFSPTPVYYPISLLVLYSSSSDRQPQSTSRLFCRIRVTKRKKYRER